MKVWYDLKPKGFYAWFLETDIDNDITECLRKHKIVFSENAKNTKRVYIVYSEEDYVATLLML